MNLDKNLLGGVSYKGDPNSGKHPWGGYKSNAGMYTWEQLKSDCKLNQNIEAMLAQLMDCNNIRACFTPGTGIEITPDGVINWTGPDVSLNGITLVDGILTGTDDSGEAYPVNLISQDAGNLITFGSDGALILDCAKVLSCINAPCEVADVEFDVNNTTCEATLTVTDSCGGEFEVVETLPDCDNTVIDQEFVPNADGTITVTWEYEDGTFKDQIIGPFGGTEDCCSTVSAGQGVVVTPTGPTSATDYRVEVALCDLPALPSTDIECNWSIPYCAAGVNARVSVNAFQSIDEDNRTANPLCNPWVLHRTLHWDNLHVNSTATAGGVNLIVSNQDSSQVSGDLTNITTRHRITALSGAFLTVLSNNSVASGLTNYLDAPNSFLTGEENIFEGENHIGAGQENVFTAESAAGMMVGLRNFSDGRWMNISGRFNDVFGDGNLVTGTSILVETSWNAVSGAAHSITTTGGGGNANVVGGDTNVLISAGANGVFGTNNQLLGDFNALGTIIDSLVHGRGNILNQDIRYSYVGGTDNIVGDNVTSVLNAMVNGARNVVVSSGCIVNGIDHSIFSLRGYAFGAQIKQYAGSINALGFGADHEMGDITPGGNQIALGNYIRVNGNNAHAIGDGLETAGLRLTNNQEDSFVCGYNTMDFGIYVDDGGPNGFSQPSTSGGAGSGGRVNRFGINARAWHFGAVAGNRSVFNIQYIPVGTAGMNNGDVFRLNAGAFSPLHIG